MPLPKTIDACKLDLFSPAEELARKYDGLTAERILRIRDLYTWLLSNPESKDRQFVDRDMEQFKVSQASAYSDLAVVKQLLPMLSDATRKYHRWKANEMLLETYRMAKEKKDTKTMERAATSYAKVNSVDLEDELKVPYDEIVPQQFTATDDPSVLGITPMPNARERIKATLEKYIKDSPDIEDVDYEDADLEEDELFADFQ